MPATALKSETAHLGPPVRAEGAKGARSTRQSTPRSPNVDLEEFAAAWEARAAREERERMGASPETESQRNDELESASGPAAVEEELPAEPVSEETLRSWTLREFSSSRLAVKVESALLSDTIWLLAGPEDVGYDTGADDTEATSRKSLEDDLPTYRASELEALMGLGKRPLRDLHRLKRIFGVHFEASAQEAAQDRPAEATEEIPLAWLEPKETQVIDRAALLAQAPTEGSRSSSDERPGT